MGRYSVAAGISAARATTDRFASRDRAFEAYNRRLQTPWRSCAPREPDPVMLRITELKLPIDHPDEDLRPAIVQRLGIASDDLLDFTLFKRSYDARKKSSELCFIYTIDLTVRDEASVLHKFADDRNVNVAPDVSYKMVGQAPAGLSVRPIVVGFGPCGIFAGLLLAQMGFKPIILERGTEVRQRTKDTWGLWRKSVLNPESNVQFGEGGAGTFSDGKLYSQIKDPKFLGRKVLHEFVKAGAPEEILYVSKPHIGTFRLTGVVENMREQIRALGGEVRFQQRVTDVLIEDGQLVGVELNGDEQIHSRHVILALGHSARDTFRMLHGRGVFMEAKPFSVGFRIEHPQSLIDRARLGKYAGHPKLGAADYKLVHHARNGRSVYSFCMCPGGTVVAATSEPNRVVTNGMSQYSRNERNANSGIVVGITPEVDYPGGPLAGIELQERLSPTPLCWAAATMKPRRSWSATSLPASRPPNWALSSRPTNRALPWVTWPWPCRHSPSKRFAKPCRRSRNRSVVIRCMMRC